MVKNGHEKNSIHIKTIIITLPKDDVKRDRETEEGTEDFSFLPQLKVFDETII